MLFEIERKITWTHIHGLCKRFQCAFLTVVFVNLHKNFIEFPALLRCQSARNTSSWLRSKIHHQRTNNHHQLGFSVDLTPVARLRGCCPIKRRKCISNTEIRDITFFWTVVQAPDMLCRRTYTLQIFLRNMHNRSYCVDCFHHCSMSFIWLKDNNIPFF